MFVRETTNISKTTIGKKIILTFEHAQRYQGIKSHNKVHINRDKNL